MKITVLLTNAAYCLQQNVANKSMNDYAKGKVWSNNLVFCALAGVLWYMQFFGLEMGTQAEMQAWLCYQTRSTGMGKNVQIADFFRP